MPTSCKICVFHIENNVQKGNARQRGGKRNKVGKDVAAVSGSDTKDETTHISVTELKTKKREKEESEHNELSKHSHKKVKTQQENSESELEKPSMSFESYLSYDQKATKKKKNRSNGKKTSKRINAVIKKQPLVKPTKSPRMPVSPKKVLGRRRTLNFWMTG